MITINLSIQNKSDISELIFFLKYQGDVVETLIKMFKQKKIGQLIDGKNYKIPLDSDLVTFSNDKDAQKTIKEYEYLLNEKQSNIG